MKFWLIFLVINLLIGFLLSFTKIYIDIKYKRSGKDDYIAINIYMIKKLIAFSMEVPIVKIASSDDCFWIESAINTPKGKDRLQTEGNSKKVNNKSLRGLRLFIRKIIYFIRLYYQTIDRILKSLVCEKLCWKTIYGSEDAAITGIMTGVIWTIKTLVLRKLESRIYYIGKPVITVTPIFGCNRFEVDFQCIFSIRLGNLIKAFRNIYDIKK